MRHIKPICASIMLLVGLYASPPLLAGPLDRMDTGPRVNPATNNMLRVPGVVGMDYQSAMATLQQAGLNPRVHMLHKQNGQYAGQEGAVVKQLPVAGGMAMLGSSVSITVYAPDNTSGPGNGMPDQGPSYEPGNGSGDMGGAGVGQEPPTTGDNGQVGADNGGSVPPAGSDGWQGPASGSAPIQQPEAPAGSPISPPMPEKNQSPVVKVPVKHPGTYPGKPGQGSGAGASPTEPERKQTPAGKPVMAPVPVKHPTIPEKKQKAPVVKVPVKRPGTRAHASGSSAEGSGPPTGPERGKTPVVHVPARKTKTRVHHARPVKHPTIPEKKQTPVVKVPVKRPGTRAHASGLSAEDSGSPIGPERRKKPVSHKPAKQARKKAAATGGDSGETLKPIDWGHKVTRGDQRPSVPKKAEGHSALLGPHQGVFGR